MTAEAQIRLTALERAFAEGEISQDELQELEALRDEAGQGWLFDPAPQECPEERPEEPIPDPSAEIARRQARSLTGHDRGEQADLFGQGLLL